MSSEEQDVIASVVESQDTHGQLENAEVGQDEGTNSEESSTVDWEAQAKYHQSEKDKLYAENQQIKAKVQEFLDSRESEEPVTPEKIALKPDEFDPWEAYNDPSSASYKFRMQEMQETINGAVDQAVGGLKAQQGRTSLRGDLIAKGLNEQEVEHFFEFADKHPSEYGLDNVLKMWRAVSQAPETVNESPLDKVRQNQANPTPAGTIAGAQPSRKSDEDKMWSGIMGAGDRTKF